MWWQLLAKFGAPLAFHWEESILCDIRSINLIPSEFGKMDLISFLHKKSWMDITKLPEVGPMTHVKCNSDNIFHNSNSHITFHVHGDLGAHLIVLHQALAVPTSRAFFDLRSFDFQR